MKQPPVRWFVQLKIALLLILSTVVALEVAQSADESLSGFRHLTASESASKRVGYKQCNMECGDKTIKCATTKAFDICPLYTVDGQKECEATKIGDLDAPKCWVCEKALPFKYCTTKAEVNCLEWEDTAPDCGKSKRPNCEWVGGKCRCKAMPAEFSKDPCPQKNCLPEKKK